MNWTMMDSGEIIRLFDEARSACSALRFDEGVAVN